MGAAAAGLPPEVVVHVQRNLIPDARLLSRSFQQAHEAHVKCRAVEPGFLRELALQAKQLNRDFDFLRSARSTAAALDIFRRGPVPA